jgi:hypothetical protein
MERVFCMTDMTSLTIQVAQQAQTMAIINNSIANETAFRAACRAFMPGYHDTGNVEAARYYASCVRALYPGPSNEAVRLTIRAWFFIGPVVWYLVFRLLRRNDMRDEFWLAVVFGLLGAVALGGVIVLLVAFWINMA